MMFWEQHQPWISGTPFVTQGLKMTLDLKMTPFSGKNNQTGATDLFKIIDIKEKKII